jgi:predicted nucleotidyltransferase component of viral defense system
MYSAAQLNDRIKNVARTLGVDDVNRVRTIVVLERIIARLVTNSFLKEHLVFGGGFVLFKELGSNRFTRDVDAIISGVSKEKLIQEVDIALKMDLDDGLWFERCDGVELETESGYGGYRFKIIYKVGLPKPSEKEKIKLRQIHLDVSIGVDLEDVALITSTKSIIPILDSIEWKIYPPEFIASEKIHCLLYRGSLNTRGKDVYDLPFILDDVKERDLATAINRTFQRREFFITSLYEVANEIDTHNLKENYKKILVQSKSSFEENWDKILSKLKKIDLLRK